jgi:hypothetical protein
MKGAAGDLQNKFDSLIHLTICLFIFICQKFSLDTVAHACNPNYLGARDGGGLRFEASPGKS